MHLPETSDLSELWGDIWLSVKHTKVCQTRETAAESVSRRDSSGFSTWLILSCWQLPWGPVVSGLHKCGLCIVMVHRKQTDSELINSTQKRCEGTVIFKMDRISTWWAAPLWWFTGYTLIEKCSQHMSACVWPSDPHHCLYLFQSASKL